MTNARVQAFIDAAVAAGCPYLVKLGTLRCYTDVDSASEYARFHAEIEAHLEKVAGAMKYTVLCPNWFFTNHLADIFGTLPMGIIAYPLAPDAKATAVDPRDVGELAAQLMMAPDPSACVSDSVTVSAKRGFWCCVCCVCVFCWATGLASVSPCPHPVHARTACSGRVMGIM